MEAVAASFSICYIFRDTGRNRTMYGLSGIRYFSYLNVYSNIVNLKRILLDRVLSIGIGEEKPVPFLVLRRRSLMR